MAIGSTSCQRPAKSRSPVRYRRKTLTWLTGEQGILRPIPFVAPWLILFGYFLLYPIGYGFYISFYKWNLLTPKQYVGLANYRRLLDDTLFQKSLHNTLFFVAVCAPLAIVIPLLLAVLIDSPILGRTFFRSAFTTPLMMSVTTVSLLWVWFLDPVFGLVNHYLDLLGLPQQHWLTQSPWSLVAVALATVWWTTGFNMVIFLAGLQEVPEDLYDAAKVDGAGVWSLFWNITLPMHSRHAALRLRDNHHRFVPCLRTDLRDDRRRSRRCLTNDWVPHLYHSISKLSDGQRVRDRLGAVSPRSRVHIDPILAAARAGLRRYRSGDDSNRE